MTTPVYVVTGFLGSGKTTFLSKILKHRKGKKILVLQFEDGESELAADDLAAFGCKKMDWTKEELEQDYEGILECITEEAELHEYQEIWVEWNGMEPFSRLEQIFLQFRLRLFLHIEKVIYLAEVALTNMMLGQTGEGAVSQVASSDLALLRGAGGSGDRKQLEGKLKSIAPDIEIHKLVWKKINQQLGKSGFNQNVIIASAIICLGLALSLAYPLEQKGIPLVTMLTVFVGIFLQGIPFLILGVLLSSAIQVFLPDGWLAKIFPKNPILGMVAGAAAGFFLPVCDCASIPVFKSLLKKGIPLPAAVCFMTAAPIVNPVVLMSTYYAFNTDIRAVLYRTGVGVACSLLIGLTFLMRKPSDYLKEDGRAFSFCTCGCYEEGANGKGAAGRLQLFLRHAQVEFYSVGKYLLIGILVSSVFQVIDLKGIKELGESSMAASIFAMILLSFLLSLCSSSDAVVARSMSGTFGFTPMLGFLVFGPMMDIKNIMMLNGYFKGRFVLRLAVTAFLVCYVAVLIFGIFGGGVAV